MHVDFGVDAKHAVKGVGTVIFQLDSVGKMEVKGILWVSKLKRSFLSISMIKKKGSCVASQDGKVLIKPS